VQREPDYYAAQSKELTKTINVVGNTVAVIMAIGAMFGALNSMYSAVAARGWKSPPCGRSVSARFSGIAVRHDRGAAAVPAGRRHRRFAGVAVLQRP
jgi:hypothetical protein